MSSGEDAAVVAKKATFTAQQIADAAKKPRAMAKESNVLVCDVAALDGSGETDVDVGTMKQVAALITADAPDIALMLIAAGSTKCTLCAYSRLESVAPGNWIDACGVLVDDQSGGGDDVAVAYQACESPLKYKDELMGRAFVYLRKQGALANDDDDDSKDDNVPKLWDL